MCGVPLCVVGGGGEYNLRLGIMKELHPYFIATCAGEPLPTTLQLLLRLLRGECRGGMCGVSVCVGGGEEYNLRLGIMKELYPDFIATCAGEPPPGGGVLESGGSAATAVAALGERMGEKRECVVWQCVCMWRQGEYNTRLGVMKELHPDFIATCAGEPALGWGVQRCVFCLGGGGRP
jgi:hypothetical protein